MSAKKEKVINELLNTIKSSDAKATKGYDTPAEVRRVDIANNIAYVHIPGGVDETPVQLTINAKEGDTVQAHIENGSAWIVGNASAPPTDDTAANRAEADAVRANVAATNAEKSAEIASDAANKAVADVAALETRVDDADDRLDTVEGDITTLEGDVSTAKTNITNLQGRVSDVEGDVTTLEGNVTNLQGRVSDAESDITTVEGNITNLQGRVTDAEDDIDDTLAGLALAQNVIGTLAWITAHSTVTTDTTPQQGTTYYIKNQDGTFEVVTDTTGKNPAQEGWYVMDESIQNYVGAHLVLTEDGLMVVPDNSGSKVLIATGQGATYTDAGTYIIDKVNNVDKVLAKFAQDGATITAANGVQIAHLGYGETYAPSGLTNYPFYTLGNRRTTIEPFDSTESYTWGSMCVYNGYIYVCVSEETTAGEWNRDDWKYYIGGYSHARGFYVTSCGVFSVADGEQVMALGNASHAVGSATRAIGENSCAEGKETFAIGKNSRAEGEYTRASGIASHAEGSNTVARGGYSHVQGKNTIASKDYQTAIGKYNIEDTETIEAKQKAFIVGNGTSGNNRSNAFTVDWDGNTEASGDIEDGTGNVLSDKVDASSLATVATSGDYDDLSNTPTIPTVNNATLTIQKNGTNVQTFTANASSNKTANITVPTKTSELTNDSGFITSAPVLSARTARNTSAYSLTNSASKVTLANNVYCGSNTSISSGGIKCAVAGTVAVSAAARIISLTSADLCQVAIYQDSTNRYMQASRSGGNTLSIAIPDVLISVDAGDIIYLYSYNGTAARGSIPANSAILTVKYLEEN